MDADVYGICWINSKSTCNLRYATRSTSNGICDAKNIDFISIGDVLKINSSNKFNGIRVFFSLICCFEWIFRLWACDYIWVESSNSGVECWLRITKKKKTHRRTNQSGIIIKFKSFRLKINKSRILSALFATVVWWVNKSTDSTRKGLKKNGLNCALRWNVKKSFANFFFRLFWILITTSERTSKRAHLTGSFRWNHIYASLFDHHFFHQVFFFYFSLVWYCLGLFSFSLVLTLSLSVSPFFFLSFSYHPTLTSWSHSIFLLLSHFNQTNVNKTSLHSRIIFRLNDCQSRFSNRQTHLWKRNKKKNEVGKDQMLMMCAIQLKTCEFLIVIVIPG